MKPKIRLLLILSTFFVFYTSPVYSRGYADVGFDFGAFWPTDQKMSQFFKKDLMISGKLGYTDLENNWEIYGKIGRYSSKSTQPEDAGKNFTLDVTPLTGTLLYHIGNRGDMIQPYLGGGVGAYFYGLKDGVYGDLETGTRFGGHLLAGIRVNITPKAAITAEYTRTMIPTPVYFNQSTNFNLESVLIGLSFHLEPVLSKNGKVYPDESNYQGQLLAEMGKVQDEIKSLKEKRKSLESRVDQFYEDDSFVTSTGINTAIRQRINLNGLAIKIFDPLLNKALISGVITSAIQKESSTELSIKNTDGWVILIEVFSTRLFIAGKQHLNFNKTNIDTSVLVISEKDENDFSRQLRTVQYLEDRIKLIDTKLEKAEQYLSKLREQWTNKPKEPVVIQQNVVVDRDPFYYHPYNYSNRPRFYYYQDYVIPTIIPSTPVSTEERQNYIKQKQAYILESKKR